MESKKKNAEKKPFNRTFITANNLKVIRRGVEYRVDAHTINWTIRCIKLLQCKMILTSINSPVFLMENSRCKNYIIYEGKKSDFFQFIQILFVDINFHIFFSLYFFAALVLFFQTKPYDIMKTSICVMTVICKGRILKSVCTYRYIYDCWVSVCIIRIR